MNKGLAITGGALMLVSIISFIFAFAGAAAHGPSSDNIIHDTEFDGTSFSYDGEILLLEIYAKGDVDCYSYTITVNDEIFDYFYKNCEYQGIDIDGYTYLGDLELYDAGNYIIDAESDVVVVDADGLIGVGFATCCGGVLCLIGIILLIVGLAIGRKSPQLVVFQQPDGSIVHQANTTMVQPYQTTVQQYVPTAQETNNQVSAVHRKEMVSEQVVESEFEPFSFEHKE